MADIYIRRGVKGFAHVNKPEWLTFLIKEDKIMANVNSVGSNYTDVYGAYNTSGTQKAETKDTQTASNTTAATFEASAKGREKASKMSASDRAALVSQLKADAQSRTEQMTSIVTKMLQKQGVTIGKADDMWKVLAGGNFTVDAATKAQAQADIAEDGYWGVSQTSQRIFDFAMALSGGDKDTMEKMRSAFAKDTSSYIVYANGDIVLKSEGSMDTGGNIFLV
mgnify:CR=1 FL=1